MTIQETSMKANPRQARLLAMAVAGCAILATAAMAQVAIDQIRPEGISIKGTVATPLRR